MGSGLMAHGSWLMAIGSSKEYLWHIAPSPTAVTEEASARPSVIGIVILSSQFSILHPRPALLLWCGAAIRAKDSPMVLLCHCTSRCTWTLSWRHWWKSLKQSKKTSRSVGSMTRDRLSPNGVSAQARRTTSLRRSSQFQQLDGAWHQRSSVDEPLLELQCATGLYVRRWSYVDP